MRGILILFGCLAVGGLLILAAIQQRRAADAPYSLQTIHDEVVRDRLAHPEYTLAKFNAIRPGMRQAQVTEILGSAGTVQSESAIAGYHTVMVGWQNEDGSNMNVTFQNGRVAMKAQFGLR